MKKTIIFASVIIAVLFAGCIPFEGNLDEVREKANGGGTRYTITFESDGGSTVKDQKVKEGGTVKKPQDPTKSGWFFVNWFSDETLQTAYKFNTPVTANITLYADWVVTGTPFYYVTFNSKGGSPIDAQTVYEGRRAYPPDDPALRGHDFDLWCTTDGTPPTTAYNFSSEVFGNLTLYARWDKVTDVPGATLAEKFAWLNNNALSDTEYNVQANANESLGPQTLSYPDYANITIKLAGGSSSLARRTISLSGNGTMFRIGDGVTLSLVDYITLQGHSNNIVSLVRVDSGGELIMNNYSTITGNRAANNGGGVYVANNGTFTMNGGTISANTADGATPKGGGVFVEGQLLAPGGGGLQPGGSFIKTGGTIYGNDADENSRNKTTNSAGGMVPIGGNAACVYGMLGGPTGSMKRKETTAGPDSYGNLNSSTNTNWDAY